MRLRLVEAEIVERDANSLGDDIDRSRRLGSFFESSPVEQHLYAKLAYIYKNKSKFI